MDGENVGRLYMGIPYGAGIWVFHMGLGCGVSMVFSIVKFHKGVTYWLPGRCSMPDMHVGVTCWLPIRFWHREVS